jgi:Zn-dependent peptidase ImmA (M78 family)
MVKRGWVESVAHPIDQMRTLLDFFGVASPAQWRQVWLEPKAAFRHTTTFKSDVGALAAWLRKGQLEAQTISCAPYHVGEFKRALRQVRALTVKPANLIFSDVRELCAAAGVAVVVVPALTKSRASGATMWLNPDKAMLLLSLRYGKDDQFWFSFFHEAGHIVLHGKRDVFLDDEPFGDDAQEDRLGTAAAADALAEHEANAFAGDMLIPRQDLLRFALAQKPYFSKEQIRAFAGKQGVAPGIVVGQLQHKGHLPYSHCNELKAAIDWSWLGVG